MKTVVLEVGYNGNTEVFNADPVKVDGNLVQVCQATKPWMVRWTHIETLRDALRKQYDSSSTLTGSL